MPIDHRKDSDLVDVQCFDLWLDLRSLAKVEASLTSSGTINSRNNRPYTRNGIRLASLRYVVENVEEARSKMVERKYEIAIDPDQYYPWVINSAITLGYSPRKMKKWLEKNKLMEYATPSVLACIRPEPIIEPEEEQVKVAEKVDKDRISPKLGRLFREAANT